MWSVFYRHLTSYQGYTRSKMDFSSHNPITSNSLNLAARNNDVTNVRRLIKKINPNCVDNRGWTCLHEAANSDSYESLVIILSHKDCRPLSETHEGHTALYLACRNHASVKTIQFLLENVKDIANYSSTEGVTPLHVVSEQGRVEIIQLLLDNGAHINAQDFDGDTPLHEACLAKNPEAIKLLLHAGANPQIQNEQLFTAFHIACVGPCLEAVTNLMFYIKDVNQRTSAGDTPLMISLHSNNDHIVYFLLDNGADPNLKNSDDKLALDIAIDIGYSDVFKRLLSVTDNDVINVNIVSRACKPHFFSLDILEALLTSDLGPKFFDYRDPCPDNCVETIDDLKPIYLTHAPLNAYLNICEYIYIMSQEKFKEYFHLFLTRGVAVNAVQPTEFPPLSYIHYCSHHSCFEEVFEIMVKQGCNVDHCSSGDNAPSITDAFLASLCLNPFTLVLMLPYSLYCDPDSIIKVADKNGVLERLPMPVLYDLLDKIGNKEMSIIEYRTNFVPSLKHISRIRVRGIIKAKDGVLKTTQQFLEILNSLPVPQIIKDYIRFL